MLRYAHDYKTGAVGMKRPLEPSQVEDLFLQAAVVFSKSAL